MKHNNTETVLFLVHNGGEYSDYSVKALFTDKILAEEFAKAADGIVEEWPANVPKTKWMNFTARLNASKKQNNWDVNLSSFSGAPFIASEEVDCQLGHFSGWGCPDPKDGCYTFGYAYSVSQSEEKARKMCLDAFWKKVSELDA